MSISKLIKQYEVLFNDLKVKKSESERLRTEFKDEVVSYLKKMAIVLNANVVHKDCKFYISDGSVRLMYSKGHPSASIECVGFAFGAGGVTINVCRDNLTSICEKAIVYPIFRQYQDIETLHEDLIAMFENLYTPEE